MINHPRYKIAIILPKLINSAPIIYYKNITDVINSYFDITVYYFKGVDEVGFKCRTIKINFYDDINFNEFRLFQSFGLKPDYFLSKNRKKILSPIVSTIHSYLFFDLKSQFNLVYSFLVGYFWVFNLRKFDKIICLTKNMMDYYRSFFISNRLTFIYSGHSVKTNYLIDHDEINFIKSFKSDKILLGIFANVTYQKGIDHVIKFISSSDKYKLLIIGDGKYLSKLKKIAKQFNVQDNCMFLGKKDNAHKYFRLIDIYILSSYQEGFGLVGLESSIYKIPIVCNDIPVFREIYNEQNVCFYNCKDSDSFHQALETTISNRDYFSNKIGELSRSKYSIDLMCLNYHKLYLSLMEN
jgi:glycosyltransferase involved in cell wall biosynthesis